MGSYLKVGEYQFDAGTSIKDAAEKIKKGEQIIRQFTIPEGFSVKDIAKLLASKNLVNEQHFIQMALAYDAASKYNLPGSTLEGYLFPDTYQYTKSITETELLEEMLQNFKRQASKLLQESSKVGLSPYQLLTLASIVEKETGKAEERPLIAAVFFNRLKINMPLATDPSVIYGIPNYDGNIRKVHLLTDGPYNTYKHAGLPPTPIANPGLKSIEAVLNPNPTEYLFFVSKGDGSHYFSKTYQEHEEAVRQYQLTKH